METARPGSGQQCNDWRREGGRHEFDLLYYLAPGKLGGKQNAKFPVHREEHNAHTTQQRAVIARVPGLEGILSPLSSMGADFWLLPP